jgi:hypothetical protein
MYWLESNIYTNYTIFRELSPGIGVELPIDRRGETVSKEMKQVVEDCVVLFAEKKLLLAKVIELFGSSNVCGCGRRHPSNECIN